MYEVELKFRAAHDPVAATLADRGVDRRRIVEQVDTYYDPPHRDFAETDEALRIRRERVRDAGGEPTPETRLTYKGRLVEAASKTRPEYETTVADHAALEGILDGLGFLPAAVVEKTRAVYHVDGYTVVLDEVTDLGEFVEVEREATNEEIATVRDGAYEICRDLGLDPEENVRTSYLELLLDEDTPE